MHPFSRNFIIELSYIKKMSDIRINQKKNSVKSFINIYFLFSAYLVYFS